MLLQYLVPGPMSRGPLGPQELTRREAMLRQWVTPGIDVTVRDSPDGPPSVETEADKAGADEVVLRGVQRAQQAGCDAVIIGCFGDPGVALVRDQINTPVIGPGEASLSQACDIGRYTIITLLDDTVVLHEQQVSALGQEASLASIKPTGIRVLDLPKDPAATTRRIIEVGREAVQRDGADVLVLGCMSMSFMGVHDQVAREVGVPVINAARAALAAANALAPSTQADNALESMNQTNDRTGTQHMSAAQ